MNDSPLYKVRWYKSAQKLDDMQERLIYNDKELKRLLAELKMNGKLYRILRVNAIEAQAKCITFKKEVDSRGTPESCT